MKITNNNDSPVCVIPFVVWTGSALAEENDCRARWEELTDKLTVTMNRINPDGYWRADVRNFGPHKQNGCKYLKHVDGNLILRCTLPKTRVYFKGYEVDGHIMLNTIHQGNTEWGIEWYIFTPVSHAEYDDWIADSSKEVM